MVCPADAIKKGDDGVVQSSLKPRCIGCSNCVLACPFGIPKIFPEREQMNRSLRPRRVPRTQHRGDQILLRLAVDMLFPGCVLEVVVRTIRASALPYRLL
jgi:Fe-S-cluster-containing dehydrogenase component